MMLDKVFFEVRHGAEPNENFKNSTPWTCIFTYNEKKMEVPFYMGEGHYGEEPDKVTVLECLFLDSSAKDYNFEDWCSTYGYNDDSISALKIYNSCLEQAEALEELLGDDFDKISEEVYEIVS